MPLFIDTVLEERVGEGPRGLDPKQEPQSCPLIMQCGSRMLHSSLGGFVMSKYAKHSIGHHEEYNKWGRLCDDTV